MRPFMDEDFLLSTETAKHLYHDYAESLPIIDYHCHLDVKEICGDRRFDNITRLWLGEDHYKWRLMRAAGVDERYITGDAPDEEKFRKWAETLPYAIGNPLYHWSHLELKRYFGYEGILNGDTAGEVWELTGAKLREESFSARNLIRSSRVEALCTTDDPADSLEYHRKLAESGYEVKVLPAFRPDRILEIEAPGWTDYLCRLEDGSGAESFGALKDVLCRRMDAFREAGCRISDHGMTAVPFAPASKDEAERIFKKRVSGETLTGEEVLRFKTALLLSLGREYHAREWVMQLHFGVIRDNSSRLFRAAGKNAGCDSIGGRLSAADLAAFLDALDGSGELPGTILYSLNPNDNAVIETVMGCFRGECFGKLQHGSAWWFNDHKDGIREHLSGLAARGLLGAFTGMLTDSRSFLSYARHEYFRRIFCDLIGSWVENGEYPDDEAALSAIVEGVCYKNAARYFRL